MEEKVIALLYGETPGMENFAGKAFVSLQDAQLRSDNIGDPQRVTPSWTANNESSGTLTY